LLDSVIELVSLIVLLLISCLSLQHLSIEKLRALKRLDLSETALENMVQGMECLTHLRNLRLNKCSEKEFPSGILPKLSPLQVFLLKERNRWGQYDLVTIKGKDVGCLRKLETSKCHFKHLSDFVEYLKSREGPKN
jgi:disease resistance protein RPS2